MTCLSFILFSQAITSRTKNELHNCSVANSMKVGSVYGIRCLDNVVKRLSAAIHALRNCIQSNVLCCSPNPFCGISCTASLPGSIFEISSPAVREPRRNCNVLQMLFLTLSEGNYFGLRSFATISNRCELEIFSHFSSTTDCATLRQLKRSTRVLKWLSC